MWDLYAYHPPRKEKTQIKQVAIVRRRTQRWTKTNNAFPNGFPYPVLNSDKMTMRSPCWEIFEKYNGDGHA